MQQPPNPYSQFQQLHTALGLTREEKQLKRERGVYDPPIRNKTLRDD